MIVLETIKLYKRWKHLDHLKIYFFCFSSAVTATTAQAPSDVLKTRKEPEPDGGGVEGRVLETESRSNLMQVTTLKNVEILESKVVTVKSFLIHVLRCCFLNFHHVFLTPLFS